MWKGVVGTVLILVSLFFFYEASMYWDQLTTATSFMIGAAAGGCMAAGFVILLWRPSHPATRYQASLPSPWERKSWR